MKPTIDIKKNYLIGKYFLNNFIMLDNHDVSIVLNWRNHENIRKWMYNNNLISPEEHLNFIEMLEKDMSSSFWLVKLEKKLNIGVIYLKNLDLINRHAYLGIYANPELKGYGEILLDLIQNVAFNVLSLRTLKLEVLSHNIKAIKLYKLASFLKEGRLKEYVFRDNTWKDVIIMGKGNPNDII